MVTAPWGQKNKRKIPWERCQAVFHNKFAFQRKKFGDSHARMYYKEVFFIAKKSKISYPTNDGRKPE